MTITELIELRKLAENAKPWRNVNIVKPSSNNDTAMIGAEMDGEFYPCVGVDCDQYYQDSKPFAEWLAAINEHGIELLDTIDATQNTALGLLAVINEERAKIKAQAKQIEALQADADSMNAALLKVARMAEALKHSVRQASIPGNDWRRELVLIANIVTELEAKAAQPLTKEWDADIEYWRKKYQELDKLYVQLEKNIGI